jgi:Fe-S cluster biogenesis protein NfuA
MKEEIRKFLAERVAPMLMMDGGGIELVDWDEKEGEVKVRLEGACHGCPGAMMTLQFGVEDALKAQFPQVKKVTALQ